MEPTPTPPDPLSGVDLDALALGDLPTLLAGVFFLPGDRLVWAVAAHAPGLARFLEIGPHSYGGVLSGCVSALAWTALLVSIAALYRAVRRLDEALTGALVGGWNGLRVRGRVAHRLVTCRLRELGRKRSAAPAAVELDAQELILDDDALRVLSILAELGPGRALAVGEAAARLGRRKDEALRVVRRLVALELIRPALAAPDGETAYALTPAGRGFVVFRRLLPQPAASVTR